MRRRGILLAMIAALTLFLSVRPSDAVLNAVDPGNPPGTYTEAFGLFPAWYQDTNGRGLELCLSKAVSPNGPMCVLLASPGFDPTQPIVFPGNFPDESFWFAADATVAAGGVNLRYVAAVEAAFANGAVEAGKQVSFARIRLFGDVPVPGTYTITHPYGVEVFEVTEVGAAREIRLTRDVGIGAPGDFTGALKGDIGPFLRADTGLISITTGGVTETFIGDPNIFQRVIGSPFGTNVLRIQGPGIDVQTDLFTLAGKISPVALASPLLVDRTTYGRTATLSQIDVFATSAPTATVTFAGTNGTVLMGGDAAGRFFGQEANPTAIPGSVTVTASNPLNAQTLQASTVTDVVSITRAEYSLGTQTLTIEASSSDETATLTLPPLSQPIPPATVTVTSSAGGSDTEDVVIVP